MKQEVRLTNYHSERCWLHSAMHSDCCILILNYYMVTSGLGSFDLRKFFSNMDAESKFIYALHVHRAGLDRVTPELKRLSCLQSYVRRQL